MFFQFQSLRHCLRIVRLFHKCQTTNKLWPNNQRGTEQTNLLNDQITVEVEITKRVSSVCEIPTEDIPAGSSPTQEILTGGNTLETSSALHQTEARDDPSRVPAASSRGAEPSEACSSPPLPTTHQFETRKARPFPPLIYHSEAIELLGCDDDPNPSDSLEAKTFCWPRPNHPILSRAFQYL